MEYYNLNDTNIDTDCIPSFMYLQNIQPNARHEIFIFGKKHLVPRYQQAYGKDYKFSNTVSHALPIPNDLQGLIHFFSTKYSVNFNALLINWYPDGQYYIGMHSDDERQIIERSPIITVAFGAARKFVTEEKASKQKSTTVMQNHDVIVMKDNFQKTHKHGVPKQLSVKSPRISITLRCFY